MFLQFNDRRQRVLVEWWTELSVLRNRKRANGDRSILLTLLKNLTLKGRTEVSPVSPATPNYIKIT